MDFSYITADLVISTAITAVLGLAALNVSLTFATFIAARVARYWFTR
ncbi:MAG TPA: hypothetical protein VIG82_06200 [Enteractinococcus sp.]